jgi:hypothetical protein
MYAPLSGNKLKDPKDRDGEMIWETTIKNNIRYTYS